MPHHCKQPKGWMTKKRLKYQLFGLYNHGAKEVTLFPHFEYWHHTANLNISFIFCYLRKLKEEGKLGRNLMLQFDNCWRDNKNKWLFGFLSLLNDHDWFNRVEVYFLKPGHSHDMVDALCFSPLGQQARDTYTYWTPDEFQFHFIHRAFRHRRKPQFLDPALVWDWQEWMAPELRNMRQQSFQRAYLFTKQPGAGAVMFYKKHLLKSTWIGMRGNPERGMVLFNNPIEGCPSILYPTPIDAEELVDMPTLAAMPAQHRRFWENFATGDQFADGDFTTLPPEWEESFWGEHHSSSSDFDISSQSEETDEDREVIVPHQNHQNLIPPEQLHVGCIIAVRPDPAYYEDHPDEIASLFWLAKIKGTKQRRGDYFYKIAWYYNTNADNPTHTAQWELNEENTDIFPYTSIIHHNIELTPRKRLLASDIRQINFILNQ